MKVLIIGAGASGLTAGHVLGERGIEFEILEASSVHGGRVRKIEGFVDFPIDLGAEWIHKWIGAKPAVFESLLKGADPRFATFVDKPRTMSVWNGKRLSARNWLRFLPIPTDLKFTDSTWFDAIATLATPALLERVHFNAPVTSIDYSGDTVTVTTESGATHEADKVLVTVPIAMLQRDAISFDPPLPTAKRSEIQAELMPGGLKVFIEFAERFYPGIVHIGWPFVNGALNECSYYNAAMGKRSSRHVLGFFTQGTPAARYTAHQTDEELATYVLAELDEIFDGAASRHHVQHVVQDWTREPFIGGSYSQRKASAEKLAEPVANRVYFAGEAMNPNGKTIAVHGACESAYAAVDAILALGSTLVVDPSGDGDAAIFDLTIDMA